MGRVKPVTTFRAWMADLDALAEAEYGRTASMMCAPAWWREFWEGGYLPSEALKASHEER